MSIKLRVGLAVVVFVAGLIVGVWLATPRRVAAPALPAALPSGTLTPQTVHEIKPGAAPGPATKVIERWHVQTKEVPVDREVVKWLNLPQMEPRFRMVFDADTYIASGEVGIKATGACEATGDGKEWRQVAKAEQDLGHSWGVVTPEARPSALLPPPALPPRWRISAMVGVSSQGEKLYVATVTRRLSRWPIHASFAAGGQTRGPWMAMGPALDLK